MADLIEFSEKFETDKKLSGHNYVEFYAPIFNPIQNNKLKIAEIGVLKGSSIKMWTRFFIQSTIFALDSEPKQLLRFTGMPRVVSVVLDQSKTDQLVSFKDTHGPFDIIIDDGSHKTQDQKLAWEILWPSINSGGWYFIEDRHWSYNERYQNPNEKLSITDYFSLILKELSFNGKCKFTNYSRYKDLILTYNQKTIKLITFTTGLIAINKR